MQFWSKVFKNFMWPVMTEYHLYHECLTRIQRIVAIMILLIVYMYYDYHSKDIQIFEIHIVIFYTPVLEVLNKIFFVILDRNMNRM